LPKLCPEKFTDTLWDEFNGKEQAGLVPEDAHAPPQLRKVEFAPGVAVSCTVEPAPNCAEQAPVSDPADWLQAICVVESVMVPAPEPAGVTLSV
jgi:hypothetical protein